MKQIFTILLLILVLTSCGNGKITDINNDKNVQSEHKIMLSSPNGGGNTGSLKNDSFRN